MCIGQMVFMIVQLCGTGTSLRVCIFIVLCGTLLQTCCMHLQTYI